MDRQIMPGPRPYSWISSEYCHQFIAWISRASLNFYFEKQSRNHGKPQASPSLVRYVLSPSYREARCKECQPYLKVMKKKVELEFQNYFTLPFTDFYPNDKMLKLEYHFLMPNGIVVPLLLNLMIKDKLVNLFQEDIQKENFKVFLQW